MNSKAPHQSIIVIKTEIMERLKDGRVTGIPVEQESRVYTFVGNNREECRKETYKFLEKIREYYKETDNA